MASLVQIKKKCPRANPFGYDCGVLHLVFDSPQYSCRLGLSICLLLCPLVTAEPNPIELARQHREEHREREALAIYHRVLESDPSHLESLTEAAYLSGRLGIIDPQQREQHYRAAVELARRSIDVSPDDGRANVVMAWALGGLAQISRPRQRVELARRMASHLEKGLEASPQDGLGWFLLGSLHFRVATAGFVERMVARVGGGLLPDVTLDDAVRSFRRAVELAPDSIRYHRDLAVALERSRQSQDSLQILQHCSSLPALLEDDAELLQSVRAQLRKQTGQR